MTLDEIAYNLLNAFRGGRSSQDENISLDQIKFNIRHYRAVFIRRDYARNGEDYLYILNNKGADYVNIRGVFESPEEASTFSDCSGVPCYTDASQFPMPMDMVQAITQGMMSGELRLLAGTLPDITTDRMQDASPNIPNTQAPQHPQQI